MSEQKTSRDGISTTGALAVAFIVLKLCGVITWSWWWVLSPVWIPFILVLILLLIAFVESMKS